MRCQDDFRVLPERVRDRQGFRIRDIQNGSCEMAAVERRYQGMQTVYDVELGGQRLEALELGTAARHDDGEIALTLPPDMCWAYRDEGAAPVD